MGVAGEIWRRFCRGRCGALRCIATRRFGKLRYLAVLKRQHVSTAPLPRSSNSKHFIGLEFEKREIFSENRQEDGTYQNRPCARGDVTALP